MAWHLVASVVLSQAQDPVGPLPLVAAPWVHLCAHNTRCAKGRGCGPAQDDVGPTPIEQLEALQESSTYGEASMWRWMEAWTRSLAARALPLPRDESAPIVEWLRGRRNASDAHVLHILRVMRCMFDQFSLTDEGCGAADAEAILGYQLSKYAIGRLWAAAHPLLSAERLDERHDSLALEGEREGRQFALLGSWLLARTENVIKEGKWFTQGPQQSPDSQPERGDRFEPLPLNASSRGPRTGQGFLFSAFDRPRLDGHFGDSFLRQALCQANATVARLRAAGDETWGVAVAMPVQATPTADALCGGETSARPRGHRTSLVSRSAAYVASRLEAAPSSRLCEGIRRVPVPIVMEASKYHPYGGHPRVFKIRTMRFSPFRFTLFLDNDANVATPQSFAFLAAAFREMRAANATIATFREAKPKGARPVAESAGACPPGRLFAIADARKWTIPIAREQNSGTMFMDSDAADVGHFLLRWEHYIGALDALNVVGGKDQQAFVYAFSETMPRWVELKLMGFLDPRTCCSRRCKKLHCAACPVCHPVTTGYCSKPRAKGGPVKFGAAAARAIKDAAT